MDILKTNPNLTNANFTNTDLKRYPRRKNDPLQAWDSADELLLKHLDPVALSRSPKPPRLLILGDQFGALSCTLETFDMTTYTDSYVSFKAIQLNSENRISPLNHLKDLTGLYDSVLLRIPKNMSFFEDILCHLTHHLNAGSKVICGSMVKHLAPASFELLNKYIGETSTSLAHKKARLIFADFQRTRVQSPYPKEVKVEVPGLFHANSKSFINHSNLFSREKLDIGTRFLLNHIPRGNSKVILDLGCGNGIIGIKAKLLNPSAQLIFSDESNMAIQSARANYRNYFQNQAPHPVQNHPQFQWTNCYEDPPPIEVDLVLCNPPFHQGTTLSDFIALQMFTDAHRVLTKGGKLRVIGNTHLQYPRRLKGIFGNSEIVAANNKFTIVDAIK